MDVFNMRVYNLVNTDCPVFSLLLEGSRQALGVSMYEI